MALNSANTIYELNKMNNLAKKYSLGTLLGAQQDILDNIQERVVKAQYDFATLGGAVGDISLGVVIPVDAIITDVVIDVLTAPTSGGAATIAVKAQTAADLLAATAIASVTGILQGVPTAGTIASAIKTTAARTVTITVAVAALTAGKFNVLVKYVLSAA